MFFVCAARINRMGCGGLVVSSQLRGRRTPPGSKPDSTEDPPCMRDLLQVKSSVGPNVSFWCGAEVWRGDASSVIVFVM
ncbi:hypothetical protein AVEN_64584-1 [Araneus ventricosus]|uniref:Uncharacterized protein n=1 Tax=Araneus ventricosus TaxID=182803 RepID=A0A4Y2WL88_ARAVE|nr:hypothetical protein AVEN_64584-1 [Araneus ventricosus]